MNANYTIRLGTPSDVPQIAKVHVASWRHAYQTILSGPALEITEQQQSLRHAKLIANSEKFYFVAEYTNSIVGFCSAGPDRTGSELYKGELYAIYIDPSQQRSGIGRSLLAASAAELKRRHLSGMLVRVIAANPAVYFYERMGAKRVTSGHLNINGQEVEELTYAWSDVSILTK